MLGAARSSARVHPRMRFSVCVCARKFYVRVCVCVCVGWPWCQPLCLIKVLACGMLRTGCLACLALVGSRNWISKPGVSQHLHC